MIFELTPDLLTLLQNSYVSWQYTEFGAACVDPKRPYGNSDVLRDICELLGWPKEGDDGEEPVFSSAQRAEARVLHEKTGTAMEIALRIGAFTPGIYHKKDGKWELLRYDWIPPHSPAHPNSISHEAGFVEPDGRLRWTAFIQDHSLGNVVQFHYSVRAYWNRGVSEGSPYNHKMDFEGFASSLEEAKSRCEALLGQRQAESEQRSKPK